MDWPKYRYVIKKTRQPASTQVAACAAIPERSQSGRTSSSEISRSFVFIGAPAFHARRANRLQQKADRSAGAPQNATATCNLTLKIPGADLLPLALMLVEAEAMRWRKPRGQQLPASASCRSKPASPLRAAQAMASSLCKSCSDARCYRVDMTTSSDRCERVRSPSDCPHVVTTQDEQGMVRVFIVLLSGLFCSLGLFVVWAFRFFFVLFGRFFAVWARARPPPKQQKESTSLPKKTSRAGKGAYFLLFGRGVVFVFVLFGRAGRGRCCFA